MSTAGPSRSLYLRPVVHAAALSLLALAPEALARPHQETDELRRELAELNALSRELGAVLRERGSANQLAQLDVLRELEAEYAARGPIAREMVALYLMGAHAELGNYAEAIRYADQSQEPAAPAAPAPPGVLGEHDAVDAVAAIADLAEQIVLVNEAHHVPQHRAFTLRLLHELRSRGFTHFAAETLEAADVELEARGYPTAASGAYIQEPLYGDLVRTALSLGYRVVPYEHATGGDRERGQATNLVDRVFAEDLEAKLLVHAGYSHIDERGLLAGVPTMGQVLRELTGIDPLTVDQTVMSERSDPRLEHPVYHAALVGGRVAGPTVFLGADGTWWAAEPGRRDLTVFHPRTVLEDGRPTWLRMDGLRVSLAIPDRLLAAGERCLVRARPADEPAEAVPLDRVEVLPERPAPVLVVPRGVLVLEAEDAAGRLLASERVEVP